MIATTGTFPHESENEFRSQLQAQGCAEGDGGGISMTKADDCPFDGMVPRRRAKPRTLALQPEIEPALDKIINAPCDSLSFGDFAKLKSGRDSFSGMKLPQLQDAVSVMDQRSIAEVFVQNESAQASCLRWMLRGLDCQKAIRKVQTDLEISERATARWKK